LQDFADNFTILFLSAFDKIDSYIENVCVCNYFYENKFPISKVS